MQMLTQTTGPPDVLDLPPEKDVAPDRPHGFPNGSVVRPTSSSPVGSIGVWIPHLKDCAPSDPEPRFSKAVHADGNLSHGLMLAGVLQESFMSSTRADIAGDIATLCLRGGPACAV